MKNIYTLGIDQITLNELRNAEYTTVPQNELPDPEQVKDSVLLLTSDIVRVEKINEIRDRYKFIPILYWYKKKGCADISPFISDVKNIKLHLFRREQRQKGSLISSESFKMKRSKYTVIRLGSSEQLRV